MKQLQQHLRQQLWSTQSEQWPWFKRFTQRTAQLFYAIGRDLMQGDLNLRAMSLVFTTLLSLVPLLALSFSVLKGFGVHDQVTPLLLPLFSALGDQAEAVVEQILGFVENVKVGVLGSVGLAMLVYTGLSLLQKIEAALNHIWQVENGRTLGERFSEYLSVMLIGPLCVFLALGITAAATNNAFVLAMQDIEPFGTLLYVASRLLPYILICAAFTFIYAFVPNTKVRLLPAFIGGVTAGILWETNGWLFAKFVAGSGNYAAIYSGFAVLIVLLIWIYVGWVILLLGSSVSFYLQNPQYLRDRKPPTQLGGEHQARLALTLMLHIGSAHRQKQAAPTTNELAHHIHLPVELVQRILAPLVQADLLTNTEQDLSRWLPTRDTNTILLNEILQVMNVEPRVGGETPELVAALIEALAQSQQTTLGQQTLETLILAQQKPSG